MVSKSLPKYTLQDIDPTLHAFLTERASYYGIAVKDLFREYMLDSTRLNKDLQAYLDYRNMNKASLSKHNLAELESCRKKSIVDAK